MEDAIVQQKWLHKRISTKKIEHKQVMIKLKDWSHLFSTREG